MRNLCALSSEEYIYTKKQIITYNFSSFMDHLMQNPGLIKENM